MIRAFILVCLASPVAAETYDWGGSSVTFADGRVTFRNELSVSAPRFSRELTDAGMSVLVLMDQGHGSAPDVMTVLPPAGYIAVPPFVTVEEHGVGVVIITPAGLS